MIAIVLTFITMTMYFSILGVINKAIWLKLLSFSISILEMIMMLAVIYVSEGGGDYLPILKVNFYSILIVGFGLGMLTFWLRSIEIATDETMPIYEEQKGKWGNKWN